jgi:hypothetical protein
MEERDFDEMNDETRARGVKRTSDTKIAEVSTSKKKAGEEATSGVPRARPSTNKFK